MGLYIKGMKPSKNCFECHLTKWIDDGCAGCVADDKIHNASRPIDCPLVEIPEPQEGHWILYDKRFPWRTWYKCSECGNYLDFSGVNGGRGEVNYCPNCGAKMTISTK